MGEDFQGLVRECIVLDIYTLSLLQRLISMRTIIYVKVEEEAETQNDKSFSVILS